MQVSLFICSLGQHKVQKRYFVIVTALNIIKSEAVDLQMTFPTQVFSMPKTTATNTVSFDIQLVPHAGREEMWPHFPILRGSKWTVSWEASYNSYFLVVSESTELQLQPNKQTNKTKQISKQIIRSDIEQGSAKYRNNAASLYNLMVSPNLGYSVHQHQREVSFWIKEKMATLRTMEKCIRSAEIAIISLNKVLQFRLSCAL